MTDWQKGGFGLYLHWPFCQAKCPYCDFNSHVVDTIDQARWKSAYLAEIARAAAETPGRILDSIYFGGGTPSLMDPDLVAAILDTIRRHWRVVNDLEITLEANPTSVEAGRFRGYHDAGVNRISMGIQALDDTSLRALGRLHSVADAWKAYDIARDTFARVSFDLIYARQNQTLNDWQRELNEALSMAADHLSLYQLTIEDGTAFGARLARGKLPGLPNEDLAADMYFLTQQMTERAGLPAYEVSNHAASGQESRHNLVYWRGGDYVGIGPGAHGRLTFDGTRHATETHLAPARWLTAVENNGTGETLRDPISPRDQGDELMMMGLRLHEGIELARYNDITGNDLTKQINDLTDLGLVMLNDGRLMLTPAGRPLLNAILRQLLA